MSNVLIAKLAKARGAYLWRETLNKLTSLCGLLCSAALALTLLAGCGKRVDVAEWTEEVMLNDGRMITVWRKATAKSGGFPEPRGADLSFELKYEPMGVHWVGPPTRSLLSFDIVDGVAWIAADVRDRETCFKRKPTDFAASFYKWSEGKWVEVPVAEYPIQVARKNLWGRYWGREPEQDSKGHISWLTKRARDSQANPPITVHQFLTTNNSYCKLHQSI
jgi:hypothetical protein